MAAGSVFLANLTLDTPTPVIALFVGIQGFGNGLALTPTRSPA